MYQGYLNAVIPRACGARQGMMCMFGGRSPPNMHIIPPFSSLASRIRKNGDF
jgi:hypothetical protein